MSDIDFDELDKAVNSLMQPKDDQPQAETPTPSDQMSTEATPEAPERTVSSVNTTSEADQPVAASSTSTSRPSLATKRRGKFMDVMHPGASAARQAATSSTARPSRQGVSLQPIGEAAPPETVSQTSIQSAATTVGAEVSSVAPSPVEPVEPAEPTPASEPSGSRSTDMPDPLDMVSSLDSESPEADTSSDDFNQPDPIDEMPAVEVEPATSSTTDDATASPFLPDAKVEKRPLGVVDQPSAEDAPADEAPVADEPAAEAPKSDEPATASSPLPMELDESLMTIEGHSTSTVEPAPEAPKKDSKADPAEPTPAVLASPSKPPVVSESPSASPALPSRTPTAPVEAGSDDDVESSIFDTTDHETLKHPAKHSTGWYTVVILAGMVVIGVLGGVVFYFMTNGN